MSLVSTSFIDAIDQYLKVQHADFAHGLRRELGLGMFSKKKKIEVSDINHIWSRLELSLQEPTVALNVTTSVAKGTFGAVEYASRNAPDLGEALSTLSQHVAHINAGVAVDLVAYGNETHLLRKNLFTAAPLTHHGTELLFAMVMKSTRQLLNRPERPLCVQFTHTKKNAHDVYERFFDCPVQFGAERDALVLPAQFLNEQIETADGRLNHVLVSEILNMTDMPTNKFFNKLTAGVYETLRQGEQANLKSLAELMGLSPRTLQRELNRKGTNFRKILTIAKMRLAKQLLLEGQSIVAVAKALEYAYPSAFITAFSKEIGTSPYQFLKKSKGT